MSRQGKSIKEILQALSQHFVVTRQAGHTTAMLDGARNYKTAEARKIVVLTCSANHAAMIRKDLVRGSTSKVDAFCYANVDKLRGQVGPVLIDHAAMHSMCDLAVGTITDLEKQVATLQARTDLLVDQNKSLEKRIAAADERLIEIHDLATPKA